MSATTLRDAVARAAAILAAAGVEDARSEARLLVREAAGVDGATLLAHGERPLEAAAERRLTALTAERAQRRPMAQVLGRRGFWEYEFRVTADTLTPRPETETLVEAALAGVAASPGRVLDLGTGTGCLLLSLLAAWPSAWGLGIDRGTAALEVARDNARVLGLHERVAFAAADWTAPVAGRFDVVVANPPYIPSAEIDRLEPEVARHEPRLALDGGRDGLDPYRVLFPQMARLLAPNGIALFEHGAGQGAPLAILARRHTLQVASVLKDLSGLERGLVLTAGRGDRVQKSAWNGRER